MGASQMWDQLERGAEQRQRLSVARGGVHQAPMGTHAAAAATGATFRQIDYWVRSGLLGRELQNIGSGSRRDFTSRHLEVIHALGHLSALGATKEWLQAAVDAMAAGPVRSEGERLLVLLDGTASRSRVESPSSATGPGWLVPLVSYAGAEGSSS